MSTSPDQPSTPDATSGDTSNPAASNPELDADNAILPSLVLVLPPHLKEAETTRGFAEAIERLRSALATRVTRHQEDAERAKSAGDAAQHALLLGKAIACADAAATLDEETVDAFGLWDQYTQQLNPQPNPHEQGEPS